MVKIGDSSFRKDWQVLKEAGAKQALQYLLDCLEMPEKLSGDLAENQALVARFADDLAPHDQLWKDFSAVVRRLMKERDFTEKTRFNRQIHQLRYVISSQQAQYIRQHYRKDDLSDQEALLTYLKANRLSYRGFDNARLHNKRLFKKETESFPDGEESYNIKILLGTATEFILDSQGNFLNEVDAETVTIKGIVNGASFNYGNTFRSHVALDVMPASIHDPQFRNQATKPFRSPNQIGKSPLLRFWKKKQVGFERSFYSKSGYYAKGGKSLVQLVKAHKKEFKRAYKRK